MAIFITKTGGEFGCVKGSIENSANINVEELQQLIKKELDLTILALLTRKPLCGVELIYILKKNFALNLSPGTLYPMLSYLEKRGLIQHKEGLKTKVYYIADQSKVSKKIKSHLEIVGVFNDYLRNLAKVDINY